MNIEVKDSRTLFPLSKISYGECFEVASLATNYTDKFVDEYFMKIKGTVPNKPDDIILVNIRNGETYSLPRSTVIYPIRAKVEVKL